MDVSVIIPCRDAAPYIGSTVRSVLHQTEPPREVIVVDDGSRDNSVRIAESFGDPVRVLRLDSGGAARARLRGAEEARGTGLMFLDADDLLAPDALASLTAVLRDNPGAVALCPWMRFEPAHEGVWLARPPSCAARGHRQDDLSAWLTGWYHPPCAVLWSRTAYGRSGGWDPRVAVNQDGDVMMRGLVRGNRIVLSETGTAFYRRAPRGHASLSGRRLTREGLASRLFVLDRVSAMLGADGRLARYSRSLDEAYRQVEDDARGRHDDVADRAAGARRELPPQTRGRTAGAQLLRHAGATADRRGGWRPAAGGRGPKVSVIIPSYNRSALLRRAIGSVLSQDFTDLELIVVDDASTDDTGASVAALDDPRLRYVRQERNQGVAAARNRGIAEARGSYVALLDSDDVWLPGKLSRQVAVLDAAPDRVGVASPGLEHVHADRSEIVRSLAEGDVFSRMLEANVLYGGSSSLLVRCAVFDMVGLFDETLPAGEDYDMWLRICRFWDVAAIDRPLVRYHDADRTSAGSARRSRDIGANLRAREILHSRYAHEMRRAGVEHRFLLETALRMTRQGWRARAVRTLLRAVRCRPRDWRLYAWLPLLLVSDGSRRTILLRARQIRGMILPAGRG